MTRKGWGSWLWYETAYCISMAFYQLAYSFRWEGGRHVPRRGPALLVANHQSFLDPVAIGLAAGRQLHFLARKTLFGNPLFGAYLRSVNVVPVDQQGVAKEGLRAVLDLLRAGHAVLMFPEGERTFSGKMNPLRPGISLIVQRSQAPVIPIGIAGAYEAFPRTKKLPQFSPLFWPATGAALAVSVGRAIDRAAFQDASREQILDVLFDEIHRVHVRAENLRRKVKKR